MSDQLFSKQKLIEKIEDGWKKFHLFIVQYDYIQLTQPKDAAGWTAKDHIIHLAIWEAGIVALLKRESRLVAMGIDQHTWEKGLDTVNDTIFKGHHELSLNDVMAQFNHTHTLLVNMLSEMSDEQLLLPYKYYDPASRKQRPIFWWVMGNTFQHYKEHQPWIKALIEGAES